MLLANQRSSADQTRIENHTSLLTMQTQSTIKIETIVSQLAPIFVCNTKFYRFCTWKNSYYN